MTARFLPISIICALLSAPSAFADMSAPLHPDNAMAAARVAPLSAHGAIDVSGLATFGADVTGAVALARFEPIQPAAPQRVLTIPNGPSSSTICLMALSSLGLWHLGRSANKLNFGHLPDWYHADGPDQIGHTTLLSLDFCLAALPICRHEQPGARRGIIRRDSGDDTLIQAQRVLAPVAPRGPPA